MDRLYGNPLAEFKHKMETISGPWQGGFPSTTWTAIRDARGPSKPEAKSGLERLLTRYWKPIYQFIRVHRKSIEEAKDLTQDFLIRMMEGRLLELADQTKGPFRAYLRTALVNFLREQGRIGSRQKRGGDKVIVSLDGADQLNPPAAEETPEGAFDREWASTLLDEGVATLRKELQQEGREVIFNVFDAYELSDANLSYPEVGERFGLPESKVKYYLQFARARLQKILRDRVADTVSSEEEFYQELREIFGA